MRKNKIGIFGGSFNPVHKGHVMVAERFIRDFSLDLLYVIPNYISPFKRELEVSGDDRAEMLKIAFSGNERVVVSDVELDRGGTSYTCDTVSHIKSLHGDSQLLLLIGDDLAESFTKWKNFRSITDNATLVVATRDGSGVENAVRVIEEAAHCRVELLHNPPFECSSSSFRAELNADSLPEGVYEYIKKRGLYGL